MIDALIWKFGYVDGLVIKDGVVVEFPKEWGDIPNSKTLKAIISEYSPMCAWQIEISLTDEKMPRYFEAIIDTMSTAQKVKLPQFDIDNYNAKKEIRSRKPK